MSKTLKGLIKYKHLLDWKGLTCLIAVEYLSSWEVWCILQEFMIRFVFSNGDYNYRRLIYNGSLHSSRSLWSKITSFVLNKFDYFREFFFFEICRQ